MTKINLVTGASGFIGVNLIGNLISKGENVIAIDIKESKYLNKLIQRNNKLKFYKLNINKEFDIKADKIWHLASTASPKLYIKDSIKTLETLFLGTNNILKLAKKYNSRVLLASSSEIYGKPIENPQNEKYNGNVNPINTRACYAEGKRIAETLFIEYFRKYQIDIRIARIFNTYGPYMELNDGRVINNFIYQALKGKRLKIFGNGFQKRSFCYISDLIQGIFLLMDKEYKSPVNLGNNEEISINELAYKIIKKIDKNLEIDYLKERLDEPKVRNPCINKANKQLNWHPKINLENGLDLTIEFIKEEIG